MAIKLSTFSNLRHSKIRIFGLKINHLATLNQSFIEFLFPDDRPELEANPTRVDEPGTAENAMSNLLLRAALQLPRRALARRRAADGPVRRRAVDRRESVVEAAPRLVELPRAERQPPLELSRADGAGLVVRLGSILWIRNFRPDFFRPKFQKGTFSNCNIFPNLLF
jgi:hypothetical protein